MKPKINITALARYQTLGMVGIVLLLTGLIASYFLIKNEQENQRRLSLLQQEFVERQQQQLRNEMNGMLDFMHYTRARAETVLIDEARDQVKQALTVAQSIYKFQQERVDDQQIQRQIIEALRNIRFFHGRGYIFIDDFDGICLLLPTAPHLEGRSLLDNQDDTGHYIMRGLIEAASNPYGDGVSRYRWYPPNDKKQMVDKIAVVGTFEPYQWIVGAGDYTYQIENDLKKEVLARVESMQFSENGYFVILSQDGYLLASGGRANRSGLHYTTFEPIERQLVESILKKTEQGGGFLSYQWYRPNSDEMGLRHSLVQPLTDWGWVVVAGLFEEQYDEILAGQQARIKDETETNQKRLLYSLMIVGLFSLVPALWYGRWLKSQLRGYERVIESRQSELVRQNHDLQIASRVFETASEGIMVTNAENKIIAVNRAFSEITGYSVEEVVNRNPSVISSGKHDFAFYQKMWDAIESEGGWQGEIWNRKRNGELYPEWLSISVYQGDKGQALNYLATFSDISERKKNEDKLQYLANYDPLTSLPNRRLLGERVEHALSWAKRGAGRHFALMFIDLDRFKNINDSLGHEQGDQALCQVALRLKNICRETDTVSRLGGDEFVILILDQLTPEKTAQAADRIIQAISQPMLLNDQRLVVTPSLGVAVYPSDGQSFEVLLRNADTALYHAKSVGRNNFQFFTESMNKRVLEHLKMEASLRDALQNEEFRLFYQPIFDLQKRQLLGCEALVRWTSPERGFVTPDSFIPVAEDTGLIVPIGEWVLREACQQVVRWNQLGYRLNVAVNLSARQFVGGDLIALVKQVLSETGCPAEQLTLEITESILMTEPEQADKILQALRLLGIAVALDDFGTGYSSLAYLKRFSLDKLKIDRSFIDGLPNDRDDCAITSSIISIAHHLQLVTVAEGIETEEQKAFLQELGCQFGQGYLYARPLPVEEFEVLVRNPPEI